MNKKILLFLLFISTNLFAQTNFDFFKGFDINLNTFSYDRLLLSDNSILVPLPFNQLNYYLDNQIVVNNPHYVPHAGNKNLKLLFARYNTNGQLLNYFTLNSSGYEILKDIKIDDNDDLYLVYEVDFGYQLNQNTYFANTIQTEQKNMIVKLGNIKNVANGQYPNVIWTKTLIGDANYINLNISNTNEVHFMAITNQVGVTIDGLFFPNPTPHSNKNLQRIIIGKLNTTTPGLAWLTNSTNNINENFTDSYIFQGSFHLKTDSNNNVYLVGNIRGAKAAFGSTTIYNDLVPNIKLFMVKLNSSGNVIWAKSPTLSLNKGLILRAVDFEIDEHNNLYLLEQYLGVSSSQSMVDYWGTSYTLNKNNSTLLKLDSNAQVIWIKQPTIDIGYNTSFILEGFKIVNTKILVFGYFKGRLDYGNGIKLQSDNDFKWLSLEINRDNKDIDNHYILDSSLPIMPLNFIGIDNNNSLWFADLTASTGQSGNIGSLNYHFTGLSDTQTLIYFRSAPITLSNKKSDLAELKLYPNPTNDILYLSTTDFHMLKYEIINTVGKAIKSGIIEQGFIPVSDLDVGLYHLKVSRNDSYKIIKFIKK